MGSTGDTPGIIGQYTLLFIDEHTKNDDPWQRNYGQPPKNLQEVLVSRSYPLVNFRSLISEKSAPDLLKSHGFGVVKHHSPFIDRLNSVDDELAEQAISQVYLPEIQQLVKDTLGARRVIIVAGSLRQGKRAPGEFKFPSGLRQVKDVVVEGNSKQRNGNQEQSNDMVSPKHKLTKQSILLLGARKSIVYKHEA
jgi:hypothetical protein